MIVERLVPNLGAALASGLAGAGIALAWMALADLQGLRPMALGFVLAVVWLVVTLVVARRSVRGSIGPYLLPISAALSAVWTYQDAANGGQTADVVQALVDWLTR